MSSICQFSYFSQKPGFDVEMSNPVDVLDIFFPMETINMKCQIYHLLYKAIEW